MEELLSEIVAREWELFHSTQSIGGPAACQNNPEQFGVQRRSQFLGWDEATLASYLEDLRSAEREGVNLIACKYAWMMESTDPLRYLALADRLPPVSPEKKALVEELVAQTVRWCEAFAEKYPRLASQGRPIRSSFDGPFDTSVETYSRGELTSYGEQTLRLLRERYRALDAQGRNLHEETVAHELELQGLGSLARVESLLAER